MTCCEREDAAYGSPRKASSLCLISFSILAVNRGAHSSCLEFQTGYSPVWKLRYHRSRVAVFTFQAWANRVSSALVFPDPHSNPRTLSFRNAILELQLTTKNQTCSHAFTLFRISRILHHDIASTLHSSHRHPFHALALQPTNNLLRVHGNALAAGSQHSDHRIDD